MLSMWYSSRLSTCKQDISGIDSLRYGVDVAGTVLVFKLFNTNNIINIACVSFVVSTLPESMVKKKK